MQKTLTIIIPSRCEPYLDKTVADLKKNALTQPEIKVMDGDNGLDMGQKINQAVKETDSKYILKIDAHCKVAKGFDIVLKTKKTPRKLASLPFGTCSAGKDNCSVLKRILPNPPKKTIK